MRRFSSTVSWPKIIRPSGTCATPRATILCARSPLTDSPSRRTSPAVMRPWCSDSRPLAARIVVVLPAPLAPSSATAWPAGSESETPRSAGALAP